MNNKLTHLDESAKIKMVDVGAKPVQLRIAVAEGFIRLQPETMTLVQDAMIKKGDVITVAEIAGIQAGKRTSELIPLCHPLITDAIDIETRIEKNGIRMQASVRCQGRTGAEMEALTAISIGLLTIYDMCKAVDKSMVLEDIHLIHKEKRS